MKYLVIPLVFLFSSALAQPVGQKCAESLRIGAASDFTLGDLVSAYKHILVTVGGAEITPVKLKQIANAGEKNFEAFFLVRDTGTVLCGQIQEALAELRKWAEKFDKTALSNLLIDALKEAISAAAFEVDQRKLAEDEAKQVSNPIHIMRERVGRSGDRIFVTSQIALLREWQSPYSHGWDFKNKKLESNKYIRPILGSSSASNYILYINEGQVIRRNLVSGEESEIIRSQHTFLGDPDLFSISADGNYVAAITTSGELYIWDANDGAQGPYVATLQNRLLYNAPNIKIAIIPNTKKILVIKNEPNFDNSIWDPSTPDLTDEIPIKESIDPRLWSVSQNSNRIVVARAQMDIIVYSLPDFQIVQPRFPVSTIGQHMAWVTISPDGNWIAAIRSSQSRSEILLWPTLHPREKLTIPFTFLPNGALAFSSDDKTLLVSSDQGQLATIDVERAFGEIK